MFTWCIIINLQSTSALFIPKYEDTNVKSPVHQCVKNVSGMNYCMYLYSEWKYMKIIFN